MSDDSRPSTLGPLNTVLAQVIVPHDRREEFVGDLIEEWQLQRIDGTGRQSAQWWFSNQILKSMPAFVGWRLARANPTLKILLPLAIILGLFLCYVDTRPTWDETGVMALAIAISCAILGGIEPRYPWLWALAVGLWIPLVEITISRGFGSILALVFAFAGAYLGSFCRHLLVRAT